MAVWLRAVLHSGSSNLTRVNVGRLDVPPTLTAGSPPGNMKSSCAGDGGNGLFKLPRSGPPVVLGVTSFGVVRRQGGGGGGGWLDGRWAWAQWTGRQAGKGPRHGGGACWLWKPAPHPRGSRCAPAVPLALQNCQEVKQGKTAGKPGAYTVRLLGQHAAWISGGVPLPPAAAL